ncbi:hypothetical protein GT354_15370, partial [Streptomyces sp. SID3343]|nr:hypothetical protein [Streptomyces sp. SID3343]
TGSGTWPACGTAFAAAAGALSAVGDVVAARAEGATTTNGAHMAAVVARMVHHRLNIG